MNSATAEAAITRWTGDAMQSRLRRRYRSERNFRLLGFGAVAVSLAFIAFLLGTMLWQGAGGLTLDLGGLDELRIDARLRIRPTLRWPACGER